MQYATVRRRAVAVILDVLIIGAISAPVWLAGSMFTSATTIPTEGGGSVVIPTGFAVSPWAGLLLGLLPLVYFTALEALYGATPGKLLLGLRVVKVDGAPIGWREAVVRNLLRYVDEIFVYLVAAISAWTSPRRQRLGDRAAQTVVVYAPAAEAARMTQADVLGARPQGPATMSAFEQPAGPVPTGR